MTTNTTDTNTTSTNKKWYRRAALTLGAPLLGLTMLTPAMTPAQAYGPPSPASTSRGADVGPLITVDDVKVWQGEEQDWNQNGDEPIVVTLMIRSTYRQSKGTTCRRIVMAPDSHVR